MSERPKATLGPREAEWMEYADQIEAENTRLRGELEAVVDEAVSRGGVAEWTPNAVGQPISTEPAPWELVRSAIEAALKATP